MKQCPTYLKIAKLGELLPAFIEPTCERLDLLVSNSVSANIATLGEGLAAEVTAVWAFTSMTAFVSLHDLSVGVL